MPNNSTMANIQFQAVSEVKLDASSNDKKRTMAAPQIAKLDRKKFKAATSAK